MKGRILLTDDNWDFLDSTKDVLEDEGYEVITANNGEDAVLYAENQCFDVILMDIRMPKVNGVESFLRMKAQNPDVKVVLITAYPMDSLISQAREGGVCAILTKPLKMCKLIKTIEFVQKNGDGGCILVADDNEDFCDNLADVLNRAGYKVAYACDGNEAKRIAEERHFDFLLLDMKLPPQNGLEVYRYIKKLYPKLATIILTGYAQEMSDIIEQTISESAYTLLTKPIDLERLLKLLQEVFEARKNGLIQKPEKGNYES